MALFRPKFAPMSVFCVSQSELGDDIDRQADSKHLPQ